MAVSLAGVASLFIADSAGNNSSHGMYHVCAYPYFNFAYTYMLPLEDNVASTHCTFLISQLYSHLTQAFKHAQFNLIF